MADTAKPVDATPESETNTAKVNLVSSRDRNGERNVAVSARRDEPRSRRSATSAEPPESSRARGVSKWLFGAGTSRAAAATLLKRPDTPQTQHVAKWPGSRARSPRPRRQIQTYETSAGAAREERRGQHRQRATWATCRSALVQDSVHGHVRERCGNLLDARRDRRGPPRKRPPPKPRGRETLGIVLADVRRGLTRPAIPRRGPLPDRADRSPVTIVTRLERSRAIWLNLLPPSCRYTVPYPTIPFFGLRRWGGTARCSSTPIAGLFSARSRDRSGHGQHARLRTWQGVGLLRAFAWWP